MLLVGRGAIAAQLHATAGAGLLMRTKTTANAISVESDELLGAFLELEATLL